MDTEKVGVRAPGTRENGTRHVSRASFLKRVVVGAGVMLSGADAILQMLRSAGPALAAGGPSISSTMPVVSTAGLFLGSVKSLQVNKALAYKDPKTGDPALVIRLASGKLVSYDAVCPHRGCAVTYDPAQQNIVCPCHGARFDPAHNAAPLLGPVSQPLIGLPIRVDAAENVYALDAKPGTHVNRLKAAPPPSSGEDDGGEDDGRTRRKHRHNGD
jgi:thiosulfate dehydrogenase (quinone) large subunit